MNFQAGKERGRTKVDVGDIDALSYKTKPTKVATSRAASMPGLPGLAFSRAKKQI